MVNIGALEAKQIFGLAAIAMGFVFFCLALINIALLGLLDALVLGWVAAILICLGSFLLFNIHVRDYVASLLVIFIALIFWNLIFLLQLPGDLQILLAPVVGIVFILVYRFFKTRKSRGHHS